MHEPTFLGQKVSENALVKSIFWHAVQWLEMRISSCILVSRPQLRSQAACVYGVNEEKIFIAPLLLLEVQRSKDPRRQRVTYLGRIDERRYFREFLDAAEKLMPSGLRPTILTGQVATLDRYRNTIPQAVEVFSEANFSEELKKKVLNETVCLWNPKRNDIAQSGVTADAVRYGVAILLTDKDPAYEELVAAGIAIEFSEEIEETIQRIDAIDVEAISDQAKQIFSQQHGQAAFYRSYFPHLTISDRVEAIND